MKLKLSRRKLFKAMGVAAVAPLFPSIVGCRGGNSGSKTWPILEGADTPKLCLGTSRNADKVQMRMIKQLGVDHVLMGGPETPWTEESLNEIIFTPYCPRHT